MCRSANNDYLNQRHRSGRGCSPNMRYFIGLDLGTTCIKALLLDETGVIAGVAGEECELIVPGKGRAEQDAESWVQLSGKVVRSVVSAAGIDPYDVAGLSISSQGITVVPVDKNYKPLRNAISWLDQRCGDEVALIRERKSDDDIRAITGIIPTPGYTLPQILWMKRNEPEMFAGVHKLLLPHDYMCARFTGFPVTDHTMAGGTMLYDVRTGCWSDKLLDLYGVDRGLLPDIKWAGTPVGELRDEAAGILGLGRKTLVFTGGQDQKVAAFGSNLRINTATLSMGTCAAMEFMFDALPSHMGCALAASPYVEPGKWVLEACVSTAGAAIKWVRDTLFPGLSFSQLDEMVTETQSSGGLFFYPYLQGSGTPFNTSAKGAFTGISLGTTAAQLVRSVYEGIAMEVRLNLNSAEDAGVTVRDFTVFGGGSKSAVLNRMLACMTGKKLRSYNCPEMGAYGAASLAARATGTGRFSLPVAAEWEVEPAQAAIYNELYELYRENIGSVLEIGKKRV